jgi:hypothetical protein
MLFRWQKALGFSILARRIHESKNIFFMAAFRLCAFIIAANGIR